jgi:hypothetical protein
MPTSSSGPLVTPRDLEVLAALDRLPLTAAQLLRTSEAFVHPFSTERRVRERLQILCASRRVRTYRYATAGPGAPNYYLLTRIGHEILHGPGASAATHHCFEPVAIARQHHTHSLAEVLTHTIVAAHRAKVRFSEYFRESALALPVGEETLRPDAAFTLVTPEGQRLHFVLELESSTERVRSDKDTDSWQRKLRLYEVLQDTASKRFRVLVVTTRNSDRLDHILALARDMAKNPQRSLVYGVALEVFLGQPSPLHAQCILNHHHRPVALIPNVPACDGRDGGAKSVVASAPAAAPLRG